MGWGFCQSGPRPAGPKSTPSDSPKQQQPSGHRHTWLRSHCSILHKLSHQPRGQLHTRAPRLWVHHCGPRLLTHRLAPTHTRGASAQSPFPLAASMTSFTAKGRGWVLPHTLGRGKATEGKGTEYLSWEKWTGERENGRATAVRAGDLGPKPCFGALKQHLNSLGLVLRICQQGYAPSSQGGC